MPQIVTFPFTIPLAPCFMCHFKHHGANTLLRGLRVRTKSMRPLANASFKADVNVRISQPPNLCGFGEGIWMGWPLYARRGEGRWINL